jgi:hypothetical protein
MLNAQGSKLDARCIGSITQWIYAAISSSSAAASQDIPNRGDIKWRTHVVDVLDIA